MTGAFAGYVIGAYAISGAAILALVVWVVVDRRAARRELTLAERAAERAPHHEADA